MQYFCRVYASCCRYTHSFELYINSNVTIFATVTKWTRKDDIAFSLMPWWIECTGQHASLSLTAGSIRDHIIFIYSIQKPTTWCSQDGATCGEMTDRISRRLNRIWCMDLYLIFWRTTIRKRMTLYDDCTLLGKWWMKMIDLISFYRSNGKDDWLRDSRSAIHWSW